MTNTTVDRARPPRPGSPMGQWAVDGTAPLNHNEEFKAQGNPLDVRARIIETYSKQGFDSIPADDLTGRFRWWGLYTQRRPGIDGASTSKLDADALSDRYFMLRIRSDGGALSTRQLREIGSLSVDFARGTADISDRQNIQLHWIRIEDVPEIWRRLDDVGLNSVEACGDTPRVIVASPVAGIAQDEILDPTPVIEAITTRYLGHPDFVNLPRKFKTSITGSTKRDVLHEIHDISLVGVRHPQLGPGYDLWVGGGLSTAPRLAQRLGAFVTEQQAPEVWAAVVCLFRDYGYRRQRTKARLKFLLAAWGTERFRRVLQEEYLGYELADGPAPAPAGAVADHLGIHPQKDGRAYLGVSPTVGRIGGQGLLTVAGLAEDSGSRRVRLTPLQQLLVLDLEPDRAPALAGELARIGLSSRPGPFTRNAIACTGIEFCKLAFVETKALAERVVAELDERLAGLGAQPPIGLHVNGCPNSCARFQIADIGLKGQVSDGQEFFQVHLGGGLSAPQRDRAELGRTVRGLKVPAGQVVDYVERVTRRYLQARRDGETFSQWAQRAEEDELR